MPRIIAGTAKGRTFRVPKSGTRPTSDKVREALFSRLDHRGYIANSVILDLFAGSGGLSLESASRGAASVTAIDIGREATDILRKNVRDTGLAVTVHQQKAETYLGSAPPSQRFDVIFCDPPYDYSDTALATVLALAAPLLVDDGLLVVERDKRSPEPVWPPGLERDDHRTWGDTTVWTATPVPETSTVDL